MSFDFARWGRGDFIVAGATLLLLIALFLPWFSAQVFGVTVPAASLDALDAHGWMYLVLLSTLAIIGYLLAGALLHQVKLPLPHRQALIAATAFVLLLTVIAFLAEPTGTSRSYGAYIGLVAALSALAAAARRWPEPASRVATTTSSAPSGPAVPDPMPMEQSPLATSAAPIVSTPISAPQAPASASGSADTQTPTVDVHTQAATSACPDCGRVNPATNRFCNSCGTALGSVPR